MMRKRGALLSFILCITMFASCISVCFADDSIIEAVIESGIELFVDAEDINEVESESINETDSDEVINEDETEPSEENQDNGIDNETGYDPESSTEELLISDENDNSDTSENNPIKQEPVADENELNSEEIENKDDETTKIDVAEKTDGEKSEEAEKSDATDKKQSKEEKVDKELDVELLLMSTSVASRVYTLRDQVYTGEVREYVYSSCIEADVVECLQGEYVAVDVIIKDTETNYINFDLCYESDFIILDDYEYGDVDFSKVKIDTYDGVVSYTAQSSYNTFADGVLFTLFFYVPEDCPTGMFELSFDSPLVRNKNYGVIDLYIFNGGIDVFPNEYLEASAPTASVASGMVAKGTKISLVSSTEGADIYYTTNGTTPTASSTRYTGPITINSNTVIKAIAVRDGLIDSEVSVFKYTILNENSPVIKVGNAKGKAGQTVNVTIALANNPGIVSMLLNLNYDNSALTLTNVVDEGVLGSQSHSNDYDLNPYILYWNNGSATQNYTVNGNIVTLTFRIKDGTEEKDYPITLSYDSDSDAIFDIDFNPVEFAIINGVVTVANTICGDVNGDSKITALDNAYLARYLAKWKGYDESVVDTSAADTNDDGKVTAMDNAVLARYLAKWKGYDLLPYIK